MERCLADLAWWYRWQPSELDELTLEEIEMWLSKATSQIQAGYPR